MRRTILLLILLGAGACNRAQENGGDLSLPASEVPVADSTVRLLVQRGVILLANRDSVPLYYAAYDAAVAAVIEWSPCVVPSDCHEKIPPYATRVVAPARSGSDTVLVFWWRLVPGHDGHYVPDRPGHVALTMPY
jgi:hypothetical protein